MLNSCFWARDALQIGSQTFKSSIRFLSIFFKSLERYQFGRKYYIILKFELLVFIYKLFHFIMEFAKKIMTEKAEKLNGKAAMLGMFALIGAYYFTGQILPGIF